MTVYRFTAEELDHARHRKDWDRPRSGGRLPSLTDDIVGDVEWLRDWLTIAFRPQPGWRVKDFQHGERLDDACTLVVANGQESRRYRFDSQRELTSSPQRLRVAVAAIAGHEMRIGHLKPAEAGDVYEALCAIGKVLAEEDELEQARDWLLRLLQDARSIEGRTMKDRATQRDALLTLKREPEFTHLDGRAIQSHPESPWPRQPVYLVDATTGELWLRAREAATYLRHILGVTISQHKLTYRWGEIGVDYHYFQTNPEPRPHLQARLYRVPRDSRDA